MMADNEIYAADADQAPCSGNFRHAHLRIAVGGRCAIKLAVHQPGENALSR